MLLDDDFVNGLKKLDVCRGFVNGSLEGKEEYLHRNYDVVGCDGKDLWKISQQQKCNWNKLLRSLIKRSILISV